MEGDRYLGIYLNDQLALGVAGRELARRAAGANSGTALGQALERLATEVREDVETLEGLMERVGASRDRLKPAVAIVGERLGRLKPNGQLRGYSPLSRFLELDMLAIGLDGKRTLWATLREQAGLGKRLPGVDFDALIERAGSQREALEPFRAAAGREAFGGGAAAPPERLDEDPAYEPPERYRGIKGG